MSGLPNLARISEGFRATADDGEVVYDYGTNAALIAATPEMARLLQECADALASATDCCARPSGTCFPPDLLARLADFDRGLA